MPFIEKDFPIEEIDPIARSESSNRTPIYKMHKWFARRVGSTFRALISGALTEEDPWDRFYDPAPLKDGRGHPYVILDPFMGGGTTLVEGHLLGCKVIGVDINPIAWFITRKELEGVSGKKIKEAFERIATQLETPLRAYYKTKCVDDHDAEIIYSFWIRNVSCENCGKSVPLFTTYTLAAPPHKNALLYCPKCRTIVEHDTSHMDSNQRKRTYNSRVVCPSCNANLDRAICPDDFHYDCPHCTFHGDITKAWLAPGTPPDVDLIAIEYYCETCSRNTGGSPDLQAEVNKKDSLNKSPFPPGRRIKVADAADITLFQTAVTAFAQVRDQFSGIYFPDQEVPWDLMETTRPRNRAFKAWHQFFNPRQLLCLSQILKAIQDLPDRRVREFFLLVFSNTLNANNMFCIYNTTRTELEPLFKNHYFSPPKAPVENNVWGGKIGRGTFVKLYRLALRGVKFQKHPYEIKFAPKTRKDGTPKCDRIESYLENVRINGKFAADFADLHGDKGDKDVLLKCGSAENLDFLPDASVDAVISDPPYYDNIMYSEVSEFFYVWLRLALHEAYPDIFGRASSRTDQEILVNAKVGKDGNFFIDGMERVFREAYRVLKTDGLLAFVFQHKRSAAWTALLHSLVNANFAVTSVFPTHGESRTGLRSFGLSYNALLVCKKKVSRNAGEITWPVFETQLRAKINEAIQAALASHPALDIEDAYVIVMGKALEVFSQHYGHLTRDGVLFGVSDLSLEFLGNFVIDALFQQVFARMPAVDDLSKMYAVVLVRKREIPKDTIGKLTRHREIDGRAFETEHLVAASTKNTRTLAVLPPRARGEFIAAKLTAGTPLAYIDGAHRLWNGWEDNEDLVAVRNRVVAAGLDTEVLAAFLCMLAERSIERDASAWKKILLKLTNVSP